MSNKGNITQNNNVTSINQSGGITQGGVYNEHKKQSLLDLIKKIIPSFLHWK